MWSFGRVAADGCCCVFAWVAASCPASNPLVVTQLVLRVVQVIPRVAPREERKSNALMSVVVVVVASRVGNVVAVFVKVGACGSSLCFVAVEVGSDDCGGGSVGH